MKSILIQTIELDKSQQDGIPRSSVPGQTRLARRIEKALNQHEDAPTRTRFGDIAEAQAIYGLKPGEFADEPAPGPAADIYAFRLVIYQMVNGQEGLRGESTRGNALQRIPKLSLRHDNTQQTSARIGRL